MDDLFESAWLKWAWAVVDADVLIDNVNLVASGQTKGKMGLRIASEYDAKRHCVVISVAEMLNSFPLLWGLLLGDAVHNLRSSLDHLAWALYKRGRTPNLGERKERNIYFPIARSRTDFRDQIRRKLPGVRQADITIVRRRQPYRRGKRNLHRHFLVTLDKLSRADKHRTLQPIVALPEHAHYTILDQGDCVIRRFAPATRRRLEPGTELGRFYVKKTGPEPYIDVEPSFSVDPAIDDRLTLQEFLGRTIEATKIILSAFAPMPRSAGAILGEVDSLKRKLNPAHSEPPSPLKG